MTPEFSPTVTRAPRRRFIISRATLTRTGLCRAIASIRDSYHRDFCCPIVRKHAVHRRAFLRSRIVPASLITVPAVAAETLITLDLNVDYFRNGLMAVVETRTRTNGRSKSDLRRNHRRLLNGRSKSKVIGFAEFIPA